MVAKIYVRIARRPGFSRQYKVDASHLNQQRPLEISGKPLKTLHFAVETTVPDTIFDDPMMPVVKVEIEPDGSFRDELVVAEQVPVEIEGEIDANSDDETGL